MPAFDPFRPPSSSPGAAGVSPWAGVPWLIAASNGGMRTKLPRFYVTPSTDEMICRIIASKKIPQWRSPHDVFRFSLALTLKVVGEYIGDPQIIAMVNQFSHLAHLETLERERDTARALYQKARQIVFDPDTTLAEKQAVKSALSNAVENTSDPQHRQELQSLLERVFQ